MMVKGSRAGGHGRCIQRRGRRDVYTVVAAGVFAAVHLGSVEADACSRPFPPLEEAIVPFEGKTIPRNSRLQVGYSNFLSGTLTGPDGETEEVEGNVEGRVVDLAPETQGLRAGSWSLRLEHVFDDEPDRVIAFEVDDVDDVDRPSFPTATGERSTVGSLIDLTGCDPPLRSIVTITAESSVADAALLVIDSDPQPRAIGVFHNGEAVGITGGDGDIDVMVADFAGNLSEPTTIVVGGCGGCAGGDAAVPSAALLVLLLRRRRR